ncbi:RNA polymerase sigma factor [Nonomuraea sp. SMC257]|uniref:RNA polymerase sigma factor n=1 Tax=Nonomuraea montanisoli TaxID=2741721 RepID=A0A7Y6IID6_9ACTN|nr:RNA polymerase sigma factor [Nonomuraea montanisoli]NUW37419.1 RNA polymerase sigma factor [Nonomuraea montanisoli]
MGPPEPRRRFEQIYTEHYAAVAAYVRRRADSPDDIADLLSETFTTAWRRLGEVPAGDRALFWLYGVARRTLANHRRGETRRTALTRRLGEELATWAGSPADRAPRAARAAFLRLSDDDRELLALAGWEGLGSAEIAKVLGCSRIAARQRLHRARKRLAAELAAADEDLTEYGPRAVRLAKESA